MPKDPRSDIIEQLSTSIADDAGNMREEELEAIGTSFDKSLADALRTFNSRIFDDDGFIKKMGDLDLNGTGDRSMVRNVLNGMRTDYVSMNVFNESELLLRRDLNNICQQMPEMQDVVKVIRDSIIECNVATGEVSRSLLFENHTGTENLESVVKDIERRYDLLMAIKNFIVPNTLRTGEMYIHVVPYAKLFAEMEALHDKKFGKSKGRDSFISTGFRESCPNGLLTSFGEAIT